jgi:membrane-bound lytic murein transglycosylase D
VPGHVTLKRPASLSELAICLGSAQGMDDGWFRTLRNLNPRLDPQDAQPAGTELQVPKELEPVYASRCVDGPWPILASDLHSAVVPDVVKPEPRRTVRPHSRYVVRRGDTLLGIVHKLGCSDVRELSDLNDLKHHRIRAGQVLRLPACRR